MSKHNLIEFEGREASVDPLAELLLDGAQKRVFQAVVNGQVNCPFWPLILTRLSLLRLILSSQVLELYLKDWVMIHKIKAMHAAGDGASIKEISRTLAISRNTVRKYLRMDEQTIQKTLQAPERHQVLDTYRNFLIGLLRCHAGLKTPRIYRKLKAKVPDVEVSERTLRRYAERLRPVVAAAQTRYYEPVIDVTVRRTHLSAVCGTTG